METRRVAPALRLAVFIPLLVAALVRGALGEERRIKGASALFPQSLPGDGLPQAPGPRTEGQADTGRLLEELRGPTNPQARKKLLINLGRMQLENGDDLKSSQLLEEAVGLGLNRRQKKEALPLLGMAYLRASRYDKALPLFHQAVDVDPKNWRRHMDLGLAYKRVDLTEEAIRSFQRALRLKDDSPEVLLPLGELCLKRSRLDEAQKHLEALVTISPRLPEVHLLLAEIYERKGELARATAELKEILPEKESLELHLRLGLLYCFQGKIPESLESYRRARELDPENPVIDLRVGLTHWHAGDLSRAEKFLTRAINRGYPGTLAHFFRALIRHQKGERRDAKDDARQALRLARGSFSALLSEEILDTPDPSLDRNR